MPQANAQLIKKLQARTGAAAEACARALELAGGDLGKAEAALAEAREAQQRPPDYLKHQFLIAMPDMLDENFQQTVSLLCEHTDKGAIGLVVNRPIDLTLADMLEQMGIEHESLNPEMPVFWGGPVQPERGFVIHRGEGHWDSSLQVCPDLFITSSRDILNAIGNGTGPTDYLVALGYAGWDGGQLESEILANSWLNAPLDENILFETPIYLRWQAATRLLGVDINQFAGPAGHA